jgi:hypothetical protein
VRGERIEFMIIILIRNATVLPNALGTCRESAVSIFCDFFFFVFTFFLYLGKGTSYRVFTTSALRVRFTTKEFFQFFFFNYYYYYFYYIYLECFSNFDIIK